MRFTLEVPRELYEGMVEQALAERPNECCGLLAGTVEDGVGRAAKRYPLINTAASPVEYLSDGRDLCAAFRDMRERGVEHLAIYHSHPTSPPVPSKTDLARAFFADTVSLIISLAGKAPEVRAWWLTETDYQEAELVVTN